MKTETFDFTTVKYDGFLEFVREFFGPEFYLQALEILESDRGRKYHFGIGENAVILTPTEFLSTVQKKLDRRIQSEKKSLSER